MKWWCQRIAPVEHKRSTKDHFTPILVNLTIKQSDSKGGRKL